MSSVKTIPLVKKLDLDSYLASDYKIFYLTGRFFFSFASSSCCLGGYFTDSDTFFSNFVNSECTVFAFCCLLVGSQDDEKCSLSFLTCFLRPCAFNSSFSSSCSCTTQPGGQTRSEFSNSASLIPLSR